MIIEIGFFPFAFPTALDPVIFPIFFAISKYEQVFPKEIAFSLFQTAFWKSVPSGASFTENLYLFPLKYSSICLKHSFKIGEISSFLGKNIGGSSWSSKTTEVTPLVLLVILIDPIGDL